MRKEQENRPLTVIFDMDGTVLDTLDDLTDATNEALAQEGLPPCTREQVRGYVGNGIGMLLRRALAGAGAEADDAAAERMEKTFYPYYRAHCADKTGPYPGILCCLDALRADGIRLGLVSNKENGAVGLLTERYFPGRFEAVQGETPAIARKPAPDMVRAVLAAMGTERRDAVFVGDSGVDIETAQNAGIPCLSVTWGFRSPDELVRSGAETLISSPKELETFLLTLHHAGL